jgi:hypothetical protein
MVTLKSTLNLYQHYLAECSLRMLLLEEKEHWIVLATSFVASSTPQPSIIATYSSAASSL